MTPTARDVLLAGLDDWVQLTEVVAWVREDDAHGLDDVAALADAVDRVLAELLDDGLVAAGTVTEQDGFVPWDLPAAAALERVRLGLLATDGEPGIGEVAWFELTPAGRAVAEAPTADA